MKINQNNLLGKSFRFAVHWWGQWGGKANFLFFWLFISGILSCNRINLRLKYMCQCNVLLLSRDLLSQQSATWHEWAHVAHSVCLKKPALFWVFHHYTNNFNIHGSLASVPKPRALPPFFRVPPPSSFPVPPSFCSFLRIAALESHSCCQTVCPLRCWMGTWEGSVSPAQEAAAYFTHREEQQFSTAGEITERSLEGRSMRQNIFLELSGSI